MEILVNEKKCLCDKRNMVIGDSELHMLGWIIKRISIFFKKSIASKYSVIFNNKDIYL